jgi:AraC family transcriptional regulator
MYILSQITFDMEIKIMETQAKRLLGMHIEMSLSTPRNQELFSAFMPRKKEISSLHTDVYSLQVYPMGYYTQFDPHKPFTKYALVEVDADTAIPDGMNEFNLDAGTYAVFDYVGDSAAFGQAMYYLLTEWMPATDYEIDDRPHFEILGAHYKRNSPDSKEQVWVPVRVHDRL